MKDTPHILLIEDEQDIADMYVSKLSKAGYSVTHKADGEQGYEELTNNPPDLLLLDVVLPKKDGFDILKDLRKHPKLHNTPVILLTNLGQKQDKAMGDKLEADNYIVKAQITPTELVDIVKHTLSQ